MVNKKPERLVNLLTEIKACLDSGNYILTKHALDRQRERSINLMETLYVLRNGHEEKRKHILIKIKMHGNTRSKERL